MGGFATRRFKGTKEIDEAATAALAAAHSNGTDGLTDDAATHFLLHALAAAGDTYATMQQDVLCLPPHAPPPAAPQAPTLPRYDRHPRPPHLNEDHEAQLHEEMRYRDHFAIEQTHSTCKFVPDAESDDDDDEDLVSCIAGWKKLEPTALPAALLPRAATPQPLEPASSAASSAVGDDEAGSSEAHAASTPTPAASGGHAKSHTKGKRAPKKGMRPLKRGAPSTAPVQDGSPKRPNTPEFAASRPPTPHGTGAHAYAALPQREDNFNDAGIEVRTTCC
jgi:hypothetical protein